MWCAGVLGGGVNIHGVDSRCDVLLCSGGGDYSWCGFAVWCTCVLGDLKRYATSHRRCEVSTPGHTAVSTLGAIVNLSICAWARANSISYGDAKSDLWN